MRTGCRHELHHRATIPHFSILEQSSKGRAHNVPSEVPHNRDRCGRNFDAVEWSCIHLEVTVTSLAHQINFRLALCENAEKGCPDVYEPRPIFGEYTSCGKAMAQGIETRSRLDPDTRSVSRLL